jgi:hypothetical protein
MATLDECLVAGDDGGAPRNLTPVGLYPSFVREVGRVGIATHSIRRTILYEIFYETSNGEYSP